ncbi:TetR/AcrR family transcriptional regulator [Actinomadura sp. ATCC 31491]|uniref:TetR/AcrR family transcriptional regulator n=1 Tax=Actinomadura luzonensis TaxID=2805427 RepID=A0ABT0FSS0_9ACTN|nr:TetR/AcrR family transcriptional regulator [Actinomadura luzonensis]MCK2215387.1 TetR/AcrR family transcriptional regulator [Actinomadura luzonensis]
MPVHDEQTGDPATTSPDPPPRRRPGGRTGRVRAQVLDAVRAELAERGYDELTVDGVAARAGVHRATVYRRWRDVGGLLTDVFEAAGDDDWQPRDTGSLLGDLIALNRENQEALTARPPIAAALLAASFRSEEAARGVARLWEDRYARCEVIVERAVRRGELPPGTDARTLLVAATAPLYHELMLLRSPVDPGLPERAARTAVLAAAAGAFTPPPPAEGQPPPPGTAPPPDGRPPPTGHD